MHPLNLSEFASSLAGAFVGALSAFALEALRRQRERRERNYEAILRTQSALLSQRNSLINVRARSSENAELFNNLKHLVFGMTQQQIDFRGLAFLGKSRDPQILLDLDVAQAGYRFFADLMNLRNKMIDSFFEHPRTEIKELDSSTGKVRAVGDQRLIDSLKQTNEAVKQSLLNAEATNATAVDELYHFARHEFPRRRLLRIIEPAGGHPSSETSIEL